MPDIPLPELRVLAEKLGYKLVPIKRYERFIPCVCGCNRRTTWFITNNSELSVSLECKRCGLEVAGKSEADAKRNWNKLIREKEDENADKRSNTGMV